MRATLHLCTTCRGGPPHPDAVAAALSSVPQYADPAASAPRILAVECLNACASGPTAALRAADGWVHVTGGLGAADAPALAAWALGGPMPGRPIASIPPYDLAEPICKEPA